MIRRYTTGRCSRRHLQQSIAADQARMTGWCRCKMRIGLTRQQLLLMPVKAHRYRRIRALCVFAWHPNPSSMHQRNPTKLNTARRMTIKPTHQIMLFISNSSRWLKGWATVKKMTTLLLFPLTFSGSVRKSTYHPLSNNYSSKNLDGTFAGWVPV